MLILEGKADVDPRTGAGRTPLMQARLCLSTNIGAVVNVLHLIATSGARALSSLLSTSPYVTYQTYNLVDVCRGTQRSAVC